MAYFSLLQAGSTLQLMDVDGALTSLTLPTGVTVDSSKTPQFTVFGRYIIIVNSPTRPLTIDVNGIVRVLSPRPPVNAPTLTAVAGGTLSGTFIVRQSYLTLDVDGNVISESALGPPSLPVTLTTQYLKVSDISLSPDTVSATRLYRTTTNGDTFFPWIIVDGNTQTTAQDDMSDASLELVAADILGSPPDLTLIKEFRERLWGVSRTDIDSLRYTEPRLMYSWPSDCRLTVPREGSDDRGITAIIARREGLAVARQDVIYQVAGDDTNNFRLVKMKETIGVEANNSIAVYRDTAYFLAKDGVYSWSDDGVRCLSDGHVRNWFTTDTYFNQSRFRFAQGLVNPLTNKYQLLLSATGSTVLDRWVEFDLDSQTWWGPHKTGAFTPTCVATLIDADKVVMPIFGSSSGFIWRSQDTRTDNVQTAIDFDVDGKFHDGGTPDIDKYFGELALIGKIQPAGLLTITPKLGGLNATTGTPIIADMTLDRQRLPRLGTGRYAQLNFRNAEVGVDCEIFGYEIPFHELGRR